MAARNVKAQEKGAAQRAKFQNSSWEQATFVNRELTESEQAICKQWEQSEEDCLVLLNTLTENRYKITFRWDDYNECQACWILPDKENADNSGLILTGRGSVAWKALKQALFKHYQLFEGVWSRETDRRGGKEIDD